MDRRNPSSFNRYAYVLGDPINSVDPAGLWPRSVGDWKNIGVGGFKVIGGVITTGAAISGSTTGIGVVLAVPGIIGGIATAVDGTSQVTAGFNGQKYTQSPQLDLLGSGLSGILAVVGAPNNWTLAAASPYADGLISVGTGVATKSPISIFLGMTQIGTAMLSTGQPPLFSVSTTPVNVTDYLAPVETIPSPVPTVIGVGGGGGAYVSSPYSPEYDDEEDNL